MNDAASSSSPEPSVKQGRGRWVATFGWVVGGIMAVALLVVVAATILLHSARFHGYLLRTVESKASAALGTRVQIQNFALHLSSLSADVYGVTVHGAEPYPDPPLLLVQHVAVG
ncbi:MAG: hypothetical protein ABI064_00260, partial [Acidobacteriaceae bacterium]